MDAMDIPAFNNADIYPYTTLIKFAYISPRLPKYAN